MKEIPCTVLIKAELDGSFTLKFIRDGQIHQVVRGLWITEMALLHTAINDSASTL